ncbi:MAG TPA: acyl-CoA dehydrogenase family protein [Polyangiaceae bacterium]|jgi:alkylation response protein AidB-like acyl-CoA dehydrogenase
MNFSLAAEQTELQRSARRFFASRCTSADVRAAMASERGWDEGAWSSACELGWASLASLGWVELCVVMEEAGRSLACVPLFSNVCLAANALRAAARLETSDALDRIESGSALGTLVAGADIRARQDGAECVLDGEALHVVDGHTADVLVVAVPDGSEGLYVVDAGAVGVVRRKVPTLDETRSLASVTLRGVRVPVANHIGDRAAVARAVHRAAVALAAESLGGAERCLDAATEYAKTRVQFGRPIGSFQAVKHRLADMLVVVETARSAVLWAASVADTDDLDELAVAAPLARSYATEAFFRCAADSLQIHGGIGFTWEHDAHLFLKRARASLSLLGTPADDRETIACLVVDTEAAWT